MRAGIVSVPDADFQRHAFCSLPGTRRATMRLLFALVVGAAGYYFYRQRQARRARGSATNASDAVDDIHLRPNAGADERLDAGVQGTFPASDPVSVSGKGETAWERQQRDKRG